MPRAGACSTPRRADWRSFPAPAGLLQVGSHAIDSDRGLIYAQIPVKAGDPPVLMVADADNLTVRERFNLPENLAGKSVLTSDGATMYSISDSGLMALPVGAWERQRSARGLHRGSAVPLEFLRAARTEQEVWLEDASGGHLDFTVTGSDSGHLGHAFVRDDARGAPVRVDPNAFANATGHRGSLAGHPLQPGGRTSLCVCAC